jgi:diguanylate cyclase (GGDEF)-like protein/PAS domain S-box-containing protein
MIVRIVTISRFVTVTLIFFVFLCEGQAYAGTEPGQIGTIRYGAEIENPPYKYVDDNMLTGFDIDFSRLVFLKTDFDIVFSADSWSRVYERLKKGEIDTCGMLAVTEDRNKEILYSKAILKSHIAVYSKKEGILKNIDGIKLEDIGKYRIGTGREHYSEAMLISRLHIIPFKTYNSVEEEIDALRSGEIDLLFENQEVVNYLIIKKNLVGSIEPRITNLYPMDMAYGVRKDYPELVSYINKRLDALIRSGAYEELYQRYFFTHSGNYYDRRRDSLILTSAAVLVGLGAIFLLLQIYIARLRRKLSLEQDFSRGIVDNSKILIVVSNMDGKIIMFNKFAEEVTGFKAGEIIGKQLCEAIFPDKRDELINWLEEIKHGSGMLRNMENRLVCPDGAGVDLLWNINVLKSADGLNTHIVSMGTDITERKKLEFMLRDSYQELEATHEELVASEEELKQQYEDLHQREEELRLSEERYRLAVEGVNDGIWDWDGRNNRLFMSRRCRNMLGYDGDRETSTIEIWRNFIHEDDVEKFLKALGNYLAEPQKKHFHMEFRTKSRDGRSRWVRIRGKAIWDNHGRPVRMAGSNTDITEQKLAEEKIHHMAYYDSMTGLPNRTLFMDRFSMAVASAQRKKRMVAVYFFDLDNFKTVNDTLGHSFGDELLARVGAHLKAHMRKGDTIARLGGDEFIMVQANIKSIGEVTRLAARILEMFQQPWVLGGHEFYVTASIGISVYPDDGGDLNALMKNADAAMYRAKELGKNNFQLFTGELNSRVAERLAVEGSLRKAIEKNELELVYQPQISLATGRIVSVEALLRWRHPDLGTIMPENFIFLAEESGLIISIGEWMLRTACRQNAIWHENGISDLRVSVNLSARQFQQRNLLSVLTGIMEETGMKPEWLELEITESIAMKDFDYTISVLGKFKEMGIGVSLDDFGTGYSSLNYLKCLPINNLKIDKSFVHGLAPDSSEAMIAGALISFAHGMRLIVTAEGVETEEQLEFLKTQKCDVVQGFLLSCPKSADELGNTLERVYF